MIFDAFKLSVWIVPIECYIRVPQWKLWFCGRKYIFGKKKPNILIFKIKFNPPPPNCQ